MKYIQTFLALSLLTNLYLSYNMLQGNKQPVSHDAITSEVPAVDGFAVKRDTFFNNEYMDYTAEVDGVLTNSGVTSHKNSVYISDNLIEVIGNDTAKLDFYVAINDTLNSIVTGIQITDKPSKAYVIIDKLDSSVVISHTEENNSIRLKLTKQR